MFSSIDFTPKMIVPDYLRHIARELLNNQGTDKHQEFLKDLSSGLVDGDKWQVEKDEEYLQF